MSDVLTSIVADTRVAVARRAAAVPLPALIEAGEQRLTGPDAFRPFRAALATSGLSVIAEHKRSSPSAGVIRADLATARAASSLPILRKDFIVEEYQVHEAVAGGADAILLIVAALDTGTLVRLHDLATQLGLATLVEVHDAIELDVAREMNADIVGINNRDLATLKVDVQRTYELLPDVPRGAAVVSESGFREPAELERLIAAGVDAVLIGEALMRSPDIEAALLNLLGSAR